METTGIVHRKVRFHTAVEEVVTSGPADSKPRPAIVQVKVVRCGAVATIGNILDIPARDVSPPPMKKASSFLSAGNPMVYVGLYKKIRTQIVPWK